MNSGYRFGATRPVLVPHQGRRLGNQRHVDLCADRDGRKLAEPAARHRIEVAAHPADARP